VANFVEVYLALEGHDNPVGINYLEKIQIPHLPSIYGAMLAGVGYVLMGAGVPVKIPGVLDQLANQAPATYPLHVTGALGREDASISFDPRDVREVDLPRLKRPRFFAIVSSNTLAATMVKKATGKVDGLVIERPMAGGHNVPPRGRRQLDAAGGPAYGERDTVDLERIRELGLPFWLAGGYGSPEKLREVLALGAAGVQVGTAFSYCEESGLRDDYKQALLRKVVSGDARVYADPVGSPMRFPLKVARLEATISEDEVYLARPRICDLGFLREAYRTPDGTIDYRCAAEPETAYVAKGGRLEDTSGRKCLCDALLATIGHSQLRWGGYVERGLVTSGDDLIGISRFFPANGTSYTARNVLEKLMKG
jgi:nitronate monooxygenase